VLAAAACFGADADWRDDRGFGLADVPVPVASVLVGLRAFPGRCRSG
jgi:hypothetical protein